MGNTGHKKYQRWKTTGTAAEIEKAKASADKFMDYLLSTMDHEVSQCCRIYQLEDVRIWVGESPDELIECLHALADHCNIPADEEKELPAEIGPNQQAALKCKVDTSWW